MKENIANQLKKDKLSDQITLEQINDFKGERVTIANVSS